ncbi:MAG: 2-phosphosulfolactate phosphatase [Acutalibacteraceae bacterium]|nr:2-phosphosulfolactate phosphatase [Acutalibacteraceae bacterium]
MKIEILHLIEGAKKAKGLTVVIDVFRAYSMEAYLMSLGAEKIIPVSLTEDAYKLKELHPEYLLAGERHGKILPGFDIGNSPSTINVSVKGKTVIHTTSAGTQGIANAVNATEILGGSLVNAKATANYIKAKKPQQLSLVCMGLEAKEQADEDTLCAEYIKSIIEDKPFDIKGGIEKLKNTTGKKFFDEKEQSVFPLKDFFMCTEYDKFKFVLTLKEDETGRKYICKG